MLKVTVFVLDGLVEKVEANGRCEVELQIAHSLCDNRVEVHLFDRNGKLKEERDAT